ncbi:monovalent cation:proton antiporter-2 (CPA2) family protein [Sphingosinicella microcystinivorans]|uniref:Kef-type potassium/proton antiporter (CPA2 family) n=1 Tax=Sphingosinicella microcystinivorans TaxID=335406 RepID=A0AAD1D9A8_SPHMI|nr:monovalent cation:proton antiporter-2 (CPA2) family protein [Sphingosinicella microcystinivorans]RKS88114.1 Kef-type potassium/proton antiporter (CPA2 family) [Sphingosinicella microcystinivorans]BBE35925.1 transporter [Sphingosinicella microcystinivorans]
MAVGGDSTLLRDGVVYLAAAVAVVPLFHRLKLGSVLGYLVAGMIIGPHLLGLVTDPEATLGFAEFGVVLLLFVIGLELRPKRLWDLRYDIFGLGSAQVLLCGFAITGALLLTTIFTWQAALVIGLALALSSTALDVQILRDQGKINTPLGQRIISIHLMQDLAIVPLLIVTTALSRTPVSESPEGWELVWKSFVAIGALVLAGRFLVNPLFRLIAQTGTREVFVIGALLMVVGSAFLMASFGLSMALGAFIAGVMLADSPYRHEVEADIDPFRGLLLGLFFMAVGMMLDLSIILKEPARILLYVTILIGVKFTVIALLTRLFGSNWRDAALTGVHLAQGGEFAFVVLTAAESGLLLASEASSLFAAAVTVSMALTPLLIAGVDRLVERDSEDHDAEGPETAENAPAIIVGYGRFGQTVNQLLAARGIPVTLIDRKPGQIELSGKFGRKVYYGDGTRLDVLRIAGAEEAQLLIYCNDRQQITNEMLGIVRRAFPNLKVLIRAFDRRHVMQLANADCDTVVREVHESAVLMGRAALKAADVDDETIDEIEAEYRERDSERLALQIASGDLRAGLDLTYGTYPLPANEGLGEIPYALDDDSPRSGHIA